MKDMIDLRFTSDDLRLFDGVVRFSKMFLSEDVIKGVRDGRKDFQGKDKEIGGFDH
jgi:hypothetical protein